jgi:hypothetical protein
MFKIFNGEETVCLWCSLTKGEIAFIAGFVVLLISTFPG